MNGITGEGWSKNLMKALMLIGAIVGVIAVVYFGLFIVTIVLGFLFQIGSSLNLDNTTVSMLTNISASFYSFAGQLIEGINLVGSVLLIVILLVVFGGLGYMGYQKIKGSKSGNRSA